MSDEPFGSGHGLVGGRGEDRASKRRYPPFEHPTVLLPYDADDHLATGRAFFADRKVEVEIGFGRGHHARDRIMQAPEHRFLLFEVRRAWVERMAKWLDRQGLDNARVIHDDARPLLLRLLADGGVHSFSVFFPDPWWKKRHHKRRVMTPETLEVMHRLLEDGGRLHFRTDVQPYFEVVEALLADHGGFDRIPPGLAADGTVLPLTHREKKCAEHGTPVHQLCAVRR